MSESNAANMCHHPAPPHQLVRNNTVWWWKSYLRAFTSHAADSVRLLHFIEGIRQVTVVLNRDNQIKVSGHDTTLGLLTAVEASRVVLRGGSTRRTFCCFVWFWLYKKQLHNNKGVVKKNVSLCAPQCTQGNMAPPLSPSQHTSHQISNHNHVITHVKMSWIR